MILMGTMSLSLVFCLMSYFGGGFDYDREMQNSKRFLYAFIVSAVIFLSLPHQSKSDKCSTESELLEINSNKKMKGDKYDNS